MTLEIEIFIIINYFDRHFKALLIICATNNRFFYSLKQVKSMIDN